MIETASPSRTALHGAFAAVDAAHADVAHAQTLVDQAAALLATAKGVHKAKHEAHHAAQNAVITGFRAGGGEQAETVASLRKDANVAQAGLATAESDVSLHEQLLSQMQGELAAAKSRLEAAQRAKSGAADVIVLTQVEELGVEIAALGKRRAHLREVLRGVSLSSTSAHNVSKLSWLTENALYDPQEAKLAYPPVLPFAQDYWKAVNLALLADPDAVLPDVPAQR